MKLKNKLEIDSTLKVGALPTASASNFSVLFENGGTVSKRTVGDIINKNSTDFIQGISNSFPSIFNYNTSTTPSDSNLVVSFKNQLAGTVFAAPTTLNGTPSFRKLIDSDLSETSIFSQLGNYVTLDTEQEITGKKTFSALYHKIGTNTSHTEFAFEGNPGDSIMRIISNYGNQSTQMQYESYPEGVGFMSFFRTDGNITVSPFTLYTRRVGLSQFTLRSGTNTEVFKISGDTTNTTNWFFQMPNANMKFALGYFTSNAAFNIEDVKAAFRGSIYTSSNVFANGFKKHNSSDDHVLLGGGGHRPVSDFALTGSLGNYVTLDTEQDITGKKTFSNAITRFGSNIDSNAHITLNTSPTESAFWIKGPDSSATGGINVFSSYAGGAFFGQRIGSREPISFSSRTSDDRVYFNLAKPSNNAVVFLATSNSTSGTIVQAPQADTKVAFGYFTSNALMTGRSFINRGAGYFSGVLDSNGFIKHGQTNDSVLLAGGGHKLVSDFALATDIPDVSGFVPNTRTITAGNGLSGGGSLAANRTITLGTPSPVGLSTTNSVTSTSHTHALDSDTISEINKGQQALTNIGTLNSLTTTNKSNLVNAINEVNGNAENYIPFTLTRNSVTQKLLNAEKYFSTYTPGKYIVIDTGRTVHYMTTYEITVRQYGSSRGSAKFLISWQDNNANFAAIDTILCSNPDLYPSVRLVKDANTNFTCIIIETSMESLAYCTVVIDRIIGNNYDNSHTIYSAENLDNFINSRTAPYSRDSYMWNKGDFTQTSVDKWNTAYNWGNHTSQGYWKQDMLQGIQSGTVSNLDESLPNGGFRTGFGTSAWGGADRPLGASYGGYIKFSAYNNGNNLDFYYNNGYASSPKRLWFRTKPGSTVTDWAELYHTGNFNPAQYVLQSSLNTQLANYVPINGVTTINNTKTFTSSPIVPNATLNGHAVNLGQLNSIIDDFDFVTDEALNSYIKKGVHNVNPEGEPFSIEANNGRLTLDEWGRFRFEEFGDQDCFFEFRHDEGPGLVVGHNHIDYEGTLAMGHLRFYGNGVVNTLSHNLNGYSRTRLPATGSAVERVLAVGATMGGSTYYANDNGLIDLPSSDGILSYSSANGIIVTDWNSFALSEYAMSLGYGSVTSGNYATSVGGLLSTTGFGSTNQGYSNSITKALGYSLGAYNSVRATLSGVFGIGLVNRNDGAFIVGRYNSELPIVPYDTTSPHTQAVFAIGAGRDDTDRYTALTVYGDGRADYTEGYDDSNWTNNTLVTKKWVQDNAGGGLPGYRNVNSSATFDLSAEYTGSAVESVYNIRTTGTVTFIGGNAVYDEGYKITIMTYSTGADIVLDSSQGVEFIRSSGSQISYLDKPNRSITFIYDKAYGSFRVYHVSELLV